MLRTLVMFCLLSGAVLAEPAPLPYDRVSLAVSAETEVENDVLVAVMTAQAEGREATGPADQVNRAMDWAIGVARKAAGVELQTLGYHSQPIYDKGEVRGWRVSQSLRLETTDARLLGDLVAQLQTQLHVQSISYRVSDQRQRGVTDELTDTALARFQTRASAVAKAMGRSSYRLVSLRINEGGLPPTPVLRAAPMMEMDSAAVAPARIDAGSQTLRVSVDGEIELSDD